MKKGELRREAILQVAERLFLEKGYDETSVQDILDVLSISKGGLYHYFDSKLAMLEEICQKRAQEEAERVRAMLRNSLMDAAQKLDALLGVPLLIENSEPRFAALVVKLSCVDGDVRLKERLRACQLQTLRPMVDEALTQGLMDGSFFFRYPAQLGEMLLLLSCDLNDAMMRILAERADEPECAIEVMSVVDAYREAVELLSGASHGKISLVDMEHFMAAFRQTAEELQVLGGKT